MRSLEQGAAYVYNRWLEGDNYLTRVLARRSGTAARGVFLATLAAYPAVCGLSWAGMLARRALGRKPRVVWGPVPILTIAESSKLLRRLGYPSTTVVFTTYHIRTDFDLNLHRAMMNPAVAPWLPSVLYLWSLLRFDVFHVFFDGGLWTGFNHTRAARWLELPLLRLAGKRVIASAYGADVRIRELNEMWQPFNICQECPAPGVYCVCGDHGRTRIKYYRDWCNVLLAMGDMHDFVPGSRSDFNYWPVDVENVPFVGAAPRAGSVRIAHSPNHRYFKGTRFLEAAFSALRARGHDIELDIVEGVTNQEARRRYAEADIVFAQCLAGWIGYTELEAMAAGKPVIGYIRDPSYLAHTEPSPLVSATPATLERELETLVADPARREHLGARGREYVEREWSYDALAPAYDELHREVWERNELRATLVRKWNDLRLGEPRYRVGTPLHGSELREWAVYSDPSVEMRRILGGLFGQPPLDDDGIPRFHHRGNYVDHPGLVARYALTGFHLALLEPAVEEHRSGFATAARWLRERLAIDEEGVGRWYHVVEIPGREREAPWVSCVSQSLGLSVLLRAEQLHPGDGFADAATAAAQLFRVPVSEQGILYERGGLAFLQESPGLDLAHALSGNLTGILGLHEYRRSRSEPWTDELLTRFVSTLRRKRLVYEELYRVAYERPSEGQAASEDTYFVVQQLRALHEVTGLDVFRTWARRLAVRLYAARVGAFVRLQAPL